MQPDAKQTWLTDKLQGDFDAFLPMGTKEAKQGAIDAWAIFGVYSNGVKTNRDVHVYSFSEEVLRQQAQQFNEAYNSTVDRARRMAPKADVEALIDTADARIKWTRDLKASLVRRQHSDYSDRHIRNCLYRPYTRKKLYFDEFWNEDRYQQYLFFPKQPQEKENVAIVVTDVASEKPFLVLATNHWTFAKSLGG